MLVVVLFDCEVVVAPDLVCLVFAKGDDEAQVKGILEILDVKAVHFCGSDGGSACCLPLLILW